MLAKDVPIGLKENLRSIPVLDRALSNHLARGFSILLSGGPGAGKSTLLSELASVFTSLYATSEEEASDVAVRMRRLELPLERTTIYAESSGERILDEAARGKYDLLVIDSTQTTSFHSFPLRSTQGAAELVLACHRWAHENDAIAVVVTQENKEGEAAGPRALEHYVDASLSLEIDALVHSGRILWTLKNRRGLAPIEIALEMTEKGLVIDESAE
jgi:DNA repair protein RadA/Sms